MSNSTSIDSGAPELLHLEKITPIQWLILLLGMIASMVEGFDIVIIAYTAPAISQDWGISPKELGLVFSAGLFGMTLGAMLLSWLADVYGRRIVVTATLAIAGVATCGVMYAHTVTELIVLRAIAGLALGVLVATLPPLVGEFSPRKHRTLIISALIAAASFGAVIGGFASAAVIENYGWKIIFLYAGITTVVLAALIYAVVPESIAFTSSRNDSDALAKVNRTLSYLRQATVDKLPPVSAEKKESATVVSLLTPHRRVTTLLSWTAFFFGFVVVYFITSWMPQVLVAGGLTQAQALQATAVIPLGSIAGTILVGWLGKFWPLSRVVAVGFLIGSVCIFVISGMLSDLAGKPFALVWLMLLLIGIFLMGAFSNLYAIAMIVYPVQVRSTGLGWSAGLGRAGAVISPLLAGWLLSLGLTMPVLFVLFATPAIVSAICAGFIKMREMA